MRKSRVFTLSLGLTAALLCAAAFTLAPAASTAGTVCQCPGWWTWQTVNSSATHPTQCPTTQCCQNAEAAAHAICGADGLCTTGSCITSCFYVGNQLKSTCTLQYVCNYCIDIPD